MGDEKRRDEDLTEGPTPQEPEPDVSGQAGPVPGEATDQLDETAPFSPIDDAEEQAPVDRDATEQLPQLDETAPFSPIEDEAAESPAPDDAAAQAPVAGDATVQTPIASDATTRLPAADQTRPQAPDHTRMMPPVPASWEGRAEVRQPHAGLRDSAPHPAAEEPPRGRTWWTPVLLGLLALGLVGVVILAAWLIGRSGSPDPQATDTPGPIVATSATPAPATTPAAPSPTASAPPVLVEVPPLIGDTQDEATGKLDAAGLSYRLEFRQSSSPRDTVIATNPGAGTRVPRLTTIVLVISLGSGDPTPTPRPTPSASAVPN